MENNDAQPAASGANDSTVHDMAVGEHFVVNPIDWKSQDQSISEAKKSSRDVVKVPCPHCDYVGQKHHVKRHVTKLHCKLINAAS